LDAGFVEVLCHDPRTGSENGLDVGFHSEATLDGVLGKQTSSNHGIGIRCVGAGSDGSNDDAAVGEFIVLALVGEFNNVLALLRRDTESFESCLILEALKKDLANMNSSTVFQSCFMWLTVIRS
jgi:hypothetical protein